jgi:DNA-binding NtrC family response regulator
MSQSEQLVIELNPMEAPTLAEVEKQYIEVVLRVVEGNKASASRLLDIDRRTLYRKLEAYGLHGRTPRR